MSCFESSDPFGKPVSPATSLRGTLSKWVAVKIMVPFWVLIIIRHLIFRVPQKGAIILTTTQMSSCMNPQVLAKSPNFGLNLRADWPFSPPLRV